MKKAQYSFSVGHPVLTTFVGVPVALFWVLWQFATVAVHGWVTGAISLAVQLAVLGIPVAIVRNVRWYRRQVALAARADYEHRAPCSGDTRLGFYGQYPPVTNEAK
jgi:hypothetical protein